jgi:ketosteroid isomerase-like protein
MAGDEVAPKRSGASSAGKSDFVREVIDVYNAGDVDRLLELFHPEIRIRGDRRFSDEAVYEGHEGLRRWIAEERRAYADFYVHPSEIRELDDGRVLVFGAIRAEGRESGRKAGAFIALLYTLKDGRVIGVETFPGTRGALLAAGLGES